MMLREPWRTRLLFVSFAVNLITIPMAAAPFVVHRLMVPPPVPGGPPRPVVMFERISRSLSGEDRDKMLAAVEPHFEEIDVARVRMEASRAAMLRAIGQAQFEPEALRSAMQNWQVAWKAWSDEFGAAFIDAIKEVSPEGRQRLADAGRRHPGPMGHGK